MATTARPDFAPHAHTYVSAPAFRASLAPCTRVPLSWGMAGGVVAGGLLVAAVTLSGRISSSSVPAVSSLLFALGAAAGLFHGALLAYVGRGPTVSRGMALRSFAAALVWMLPCGVSAWIASIWIGLTAAALHLGRATVYGGVALGWAVGLSVCAWALMEGAACMRRTLDGRPRRRRAALAGSVTFGVLVVVFHSLSPEIPFTGFHVTGVTAIVVAFLASVWIALPVVLAILEVAARVRGRIPTR